MQLRQSKVIRAFDDNGVGGRDVDPGLDNRGTHQHVKALMVEVVHYPFQFALAHLPMTNRDARFRHQFRQTVGGFLDVFDVVIQVIDTAAAQDFTQDRLAHDRVIVFTDEGFTASRRVGGVAMIDRSRIPLIAILSVRGMGVAVRVRISTSARIALIRSL